MPGEGKHRGQFRFVPLLVGEPGTPNTIKQTIFSKDMIDILWMILFTKITPAGHSLLTKGSQHIVKRTSTKVKLNQAYTLISKPIATNAIEFKHSEADSTIAICCCLEE
jgi:hypothetical protein